MAEGLRIRAALFVVRDGRVLLAEHLKDGKRYFLLPGGGVDEGEAWGQAAAREVAEELGVAARAGALLALFENRSPDGARWILHAVFHGAIDGEPRATGDDPRVVGCRWASPAELGDLPVMPAVADCLARWILEGAPGGAECARLHWVHA